MASSSYQEDDDFVKEWCEQYGLDSNTVAALKSRDFDDLPKLIALKRTDIDALDISENQKALLRGALLQYKEIDLAIQMVEAKKSNPERAKRLANVVASYKVAQVSELNKSRSDGDFQKLKRRLTRRKEANRPSVSLADRLKAERKQATEAHEKAAQGTTEKKVTDTKIDGSIQDNAKDIDKENIQSCSAISNVNSQIKRSKSLDYWKDTQDIDAELELLEKQLDRDLEEIIKELSLPLERNAKPHSKNQIPLNDDLLKTLEILDKQLFDDEELELLKSLKNNKE